MRTIQLQPMTADLGEEVFSKSLAGFLHLRIAEAGANEGAVSTSPERNEPVGVLAELAPRDARASFSGA